MALYKGNIKVSGVGKGFNPENEGTEGQVLTKTATGYAYCDSQGGGDTGPKLDIMVVGGGGSGGSFAGGGGGGAFCQDGVGGTGCQGIVIIKYPTDGSYGISSSTGGDNCYTCNGYCYVEFTQNGTFTPTYS